MRHLDLDCLEVDRSQFGSKFSIVHLIDFVTKGLYFGDDSTMGDQRGNYVPEQIDMR